MNDKNDATLVGYDQIIVDSGGLVLKLATLLILWAVCFIPVYPSLVWTWFNNSNNSHGVLVPLVSAYLIWQKRADLCRTPGGVSWWGGVILLISLLFYLLSLAGAIAVVSRAMLVTSLIGILLFTIGKAKVSTITFPLLFLLFMVPAPASLLQLVAFPLQMFATKIAANIIAALNIPVYREGNMLFFVHAQLEVAEACSGIRSIMAYTMLSTLFAYFLQGGWGKRIVLLLSAVPMALCANIVRVTGTGILAHFFGGSVAKGFLHEFSGMVVFVFGLCLLGAEFQALGRLENKTQKGAA